jgi:hypothetical protein
LWGDGEQECDGFGEVADKFAGGFEEPFGDVTESGAPLLELPDGDDAAGPITAEEPDGPCGVIRGHDAEVLDERSNVVAGASGAVEFFAEAREVLHVAGSE